MALDSDILNDFKNETNALLTELDEVVEKLEDHGEEFPDKLLEEFAQKIDRVMGAAKTLSLMQPDHAGLIRIGQLAQICKSSGYKAAEKRVAALVPLFSAFWADVIEAIGSLVATLDNAEKNTEIAMEFSAVLEKRLEWLATKVDKGIGVMGKDFK